jgi:hypothetical protein
VDDHLGYLMAIKVFWLDYGSNQSPRSYLSVIPLAVEAKSQQQATDGEKEGFVRLMSDLEILNRNETG